MKRGFVLIPGAGLSDWVWAKLIPLLNMEAVSIPRRIEHNTCENRLSSGFGDILDYAERVIRCSGLDEVILVGHSGAGLIAGELGERIQHVKHVVFLAANIPLHGGTALELFSEEVRTSMIAAVKRQALADAIPIKNLEPTFRAYFCNRTPEEDIAYILQQDFLPEPVCVLTHPADWRSYPEVGMSYILCKDDRTLTVSQQECAAANLGITDIRRISSDHMIMISQAELLSNELNDIGLAECR